MLVKDGYNRSKIRVGKQFNTLTPKQIRTSLDAKPVQEKIEQK
jgi:hypothetical protein